MTEGRPLTETPHGEGTTAPPSASPRSANRNRFVRRLVSDTTVKIALVTIILIVLAAIFAPLLTPYTFAETTGAPMQPPSSMNWLGTDEIGRDIFTRLLYAGRVSLGVGAVASLIAAVVGVPWGLISGYYGGRIDGVSMRLTDALLAFPGIVLAMAAVAVLGPNLVNTMIAIGIVQIPRLTRLVRAEVLSLKGREYVLACHAQGASDGHILRHAIFPNVVAVVTVQLGLTFALAILTEAALSFIGLGVQPPTPSWGVMLNTARQFLGINVLYSLVAGGAIFITVLSLTLVSDGLTEAVDPRQL